MDEKVINQNINDKVVEQYFEELEITNSILNKVDFKTSTFNYLEINTSKIENCLFINLNLSEQSIYKTIF